jgi:hypothetical protein
VRESVISRNRAEGVFTTSAVESDRFVLLRSVVQGNGDNGLDLRTEGAVRDSVIFGNAGGGIDLGVHSTEPDTGYVRGNAVRSNLYGFAFDPTQVGYLHNAFTNNTNPSSGGTEIGTNLCDLDSTCP